VRDAETGEPLAGVPVTVGSQQLLADAQGRFQVQGVLGIARVRAAVPGYKAAQATPLPAGLFSREQNATLSLTPVALEGTALDATTGEPVPGAWVRAGDVEAQSDAQGHYVVKRVRPDATITAGATYYQDAAPVPYEGQATLDVALTLLPVTVQVRNLYSGEPLPGVTVTAGGRQAQTDAEGQAVYDRLEPRSEVTAALAGFATSGVQAASPGDTVAIGLRPDTLQGSVRDQAGQPLAGALVLVRAPGQEPRLAYSNEAGAYQLEGVPADAAIVVRLAGYARVERPLGHETEADFVLEPFEAKGLYIPFGLLVRGAEAQVQEDLDLVLRTEMNTVVIDIKSDRGYLAFVPQDPLLQEIGAASDLVVDIRQVLQECRQRGIYTIARIVAFKDNILAEARPEWAVLSAKGGLWRDLEGLAWADPFREEVWGYNLAIAMEAAALGFDEVQFDYLRFPSDGDIFDMVFIKESFRDPRCQAIADFLAYVRRELDKTGVFLSADLFGLVTSVDPNQRLGDLGIGQRLIDVAPWVDYISPMVYPSMYEPGHLGLADPWRSPYEVVKISVDDAQKQTTTLIRPWLQHYSLFGVAYGPREFRLEKQGAADAQAHGWLFWNAGGVYEPAAFDPE